MVDPNKVINFAKLSWQELKPDDDYEVKLEMAPEIIKVHEGFVRCYMENDFDVDRVIKIMTDFKNDKSDFFTEDGIKWHQRLAECLKRLNRDFDKAARRGKG